MLAWQVPGEGTRKMFFFLVADQIAQRGPGHLGLGLYLISQKMTISQQPPYNKQCKLITGFYINY